MGYKVYRRPKKQVDKYAGKPGLFFDLLGRAIINASGARILKQNDMKIAGWLWDEDRRRIAFRGVEKGMGIGYKVTYGPEKRFAAITAWKFLVSIKRENLMGRSFFLTWDKEEQIMELQGEVGEFVGSFGQDFE